MNHNESSLNASVSGTTETTQQILTFVNEGASVDTSALPLQTPTVPQSVKDATLTQSTRHDVTTFLQRPIILTNVSWGITDIPNFELYSANFPEALIANTMYREKMEGFLGLRGTLIVRVQVNSQPFQQGRLLLGYVPYAQYIPAKASLATASLTGSTGCPHVDLDLSTATEMILRVPYCSPHVFYNLVTGQGSFGLVFLKVYSPLISMDASDVDITVFAHLENVELVVPTGAPVYTGSGPNLESKIRELRFAKSEEQARSIMTWDHKHNTAPTFAQSGEEAQSQTSGWITQASQGFSTAFGGLANSKLPLIATASDWASKIFKVGQHIAASFGWSKPSLLSNIQLSKLSTGRYMQNAIGEDACNSMGLNPNNRIAPFSFSGTKLDEMSLAYIASTPNFLYSFQWQNSNLPNDVLYHTFLSPQTTRVDLGVPGFSVPTHLHFVASAFRLWRGSLVYTFKVVKTKFHSGRLRFIYVPGFFGSTLVGVQVEKCLSFVMDLREQSEITVTIPYENTRPWLNMDSYEVSPAENDNSFFLGTLYVIVLNRLVAVSTVSPLVNILVEVNGSSDMRFAVPVHPKYYAARGYEPVVAQSGDELTRADAQLGKRLHEFDTVIDNGGTAEHLCTGEEVRSIKQLMHRFGLFSAIRSDVTAPLGFVPGDPTQNFMVVCPYAMARAIDPNSNPGTTTSPTLRVDWVDYFSLPFVFARGAMRFKFALNDITSNYPGGLPTVTDQWRLNKMFVKLYNSFFSYEYPDLTNGKFNRLAGGDGRTATIPMTTPARPYGNLLLYSDSTTTVATAIEGIAEIEVPYYNVGHMMPVEIPVFDSGTYTYPKVFRGDLPTSLLGMWTDAETDVPLRTAVYRACGDDFQLGFLIGMPICTTLDRAIISNWDNPITHPYT